MVEICLVNFKCLATAIPKLERGSQNFKRWSHDDPDYPLFDQDLSKNLANFCLSQRFRLHKVHEHSSTSFRCNHIYCLKRVAGKVDPSPDPDQNQ